MSARAATAAQSMVAMNRQSQGTRGRRSNVKSRVSRSVSASTSEDDRDEASSGMGESEDDAKDGETPWLLNDLSRSRSRWEMENECT